MAVHTDDPCPSHRRFPVDVPVTVEDKAGLRPLDVGSQRLKL
jgi:hypothetical protein